MKEGTQTVKNQRERKIAKREEAFKAWVSSNNSISQNSLQSCLRDPAPSRTLRGHDPTPFPLPTLHAVSSVCQEHWVRKITFPRSARPSWQEELFHFWSDPRAYEGTCGAGLARVLWRRGISF